MHLLAALLVAPDPAAVDAVLADALRAFDVPGAAVVVVRGGRPVVLKGYGRKAVADPAPVTANTAFPLASCTKAFTSALIASLVDDGKLGWDDRVPDFRLSDPAADAKLTVRDLLSHRTGLGGHDMLWYKSPLTVDEVILRAGKLPLDYPFRGGFRYSSIPVMAAGRLAAKAGGEPWEALVRKRLCDPLGMAGVTFTTAELNACADRASGHRSGPDGKPVPMPPHELREPNPAGSVNASARDLAPWLAFHLGPGSRVVTAKNLTTTWEAHNPLPFDGGVKAMNPDSTHLAHGLGWITQDYRGKRLVLHGGTIDGFRAQVSFLPDDDLGVAVLNNLHDTRMNQAVTNTLIDLYLGLPSRDWNAFYVNVMADQKADKDAARTARDKLRDPAVKPSLPIEGYAGAYAHPAYGTATVTVADGKLTLAWSSFRVPLEAYRGDVFEPTAEPFRDGLVTFDVTAGKATAVTFLGQTFARK